MTIDDPSGGGERPQPGDTPKGTAKGHIPTGQAKASGQARPTAHELARYESLFAERTHGMRSSAMRDMMSLTERPEVISLAGGLPETKTFPPELYAKLMSKVAAESTARALQYGPTEGMACTVQCIVQVMAEEGTSVDPDEVLVTTGGQQVIDLMCKAFIDPGDTIVAEAPTYPGAVPTFDAYQANVVQIEMDSDGMPIDELEATLDRLGRRRAQPEVHLHDPQLPKPGRRDDVAGAAAAPGRGGARARDPRAGGQSVWTAALRGRSAAHACTRSTRPPPNAAGPLTSSSIWVPSRRSSRRACAWAGRSRRRPVMEKLNLCKQGADLCSSPVTQLFVAAYFEESARSGWRCVARAARRSARA